MTRFNRAALARHKASAGIAKRLFLYSTASLVVTKITLLCVQNNSSLSHPFPPSMHDDEFETIKHPLHEYMDDEKNAEMKVPKFWDPPEFQPFGGIREYLGYGRRLMTKEEALRIGSTVTVQDKRLETIVVAVSSYRDWMCRYTVENVFHRAKYTERVRMVVIDQIQDGDVSCSKPIKPCADDPEQALCKFKDRIDVFTMDAALANGPIFARHLAYRFYRGEYFFMQCDAHVQVTQDWDVDIINHWKMAKNEMAVLTNYAHAVQRGIDEETGKSLVDEFEVMCDPIYEEEDGEGLHIRHDENTIVERKMTQVKGEPQLEPYWAAGLSFSRGHFIVNIPYDQHLPFVFQGEEISIAIRGFTYGYDFYAPQISNVFHFYKRPEDPEGKSMSYSASGDPPPKFWNTGKWNDAAEIKAYKRLNGIIHMSNPNVTDDMWNHDDEQFYGIGNVRTPELFFDTFGIHTKTQTIEPNLCMFVTLGTMHFIFTPHLRADGMGIDYSKLNGYTFKDTWGKVGYWWDWEPKWAQE